MLPYNSTEKLQSWCSNCSRPIGTAEGLDHFLDAALPTPHGLGSLGPQRDYAHAEDEVSPDCEHLCAVAASRYARRRKSAEARCRHPRERAGVADHGPGGWRTSDPGRRPSPARSVPGTRGNDDPELPRPSPASLRRTDQKGPSHAGTRSGSDPREGALARQ